jgi:hypothetical protein
MVRISRRGFLAGTGGLVLLRQPQWSIVVSPSLSPDMRKGIELGAVEAGQMAKLLGQAIGLVEGTPADASRVAGVITGSPPAKAGADVPVVLLKSAGARESPCVFTVGASDARKAAALNQWLAKEGKPDPGDLSVVEWHATLRRFGASEVNERFQAQHKAPMSPESWLGWVAVKALAEAAMRRIGSGACEAFARLRFDGHKGRALRFDPETGELQQPLYIVQGSPDGGRVLGEVMP